MPYIVAAAFNIPTGLFVSKFGQRMTIIFFGQAMLLAAFIIFIQIENCDKCLLSKVPLFMMGITYSSYATVQWAIIPYLVEEKFLGTAFGVLTVIQNLLTVAIPPITGLIKENTSEINMGYTWVEIFFLA